MKMNVPHISDDSRGWEAIDIFLFSNGQQYSPPRKYHLVSDDLKLWDTTKTFLARSQYGSMHSAIDIYSLDGKKIEGPLELRNAAAYVAVEPTDAFIPAGYEKYLFKASRSWEKRQGKLSNNNDIEKTDTAGMYIDITTIEQIEGIVTLKMENHSPNEPANNQPRKMIEKPTIPKFNSVKNEKLNSKRISSDIERNTNLKKNNSCLMKCNKNFKCITKSTSLKPQNRNSNQQAISSKYTRRSKTSPRGNSIEYKVNSQTHNHKIAEENLVNNRSYGDESLKKTTEVELPIVSNIYTNENDVQSVIFEADRKATVENNSIKTLPEMNKEITRLNDEQIQIHPDSVDDNKGKLNILLRIKLEDFTSSITSENDKSVTRVGSIITLIKKEKASQVNIDVILSKDIFTFNKFLLKGKSIESNTTPQNENHNGTDQEILVCCPCDEFNKPQDNFFNSSYRKNTIELSTELNKIESNCKCLPTRDQNKMVDMGTQMSICSSDPLNSQKNLEEKSKNIETQDFDMMVQEDSKEIKSERQADFERDVIVKAIEIPLTRSKEFEDKFVQTEWCNLLLQAKSHEDGRYTFHLPALSLLKQYTIDQM